MYPTLLHIHSILRWIIIIFFIGALITSYNIWKKEKSLSDFWIKYLVYLVEFQFVIGLALYFTSPKVIFAADSMKHTITRFFLVEHITLMVIAIAILSIGGAKWKRSPKDAASAKKLFIFTLISLILILISIPWPFRELGSGWL